MCPDASLLAWQIYRFGLPSIHGISSCVSDRYCAPSCDGGCFHVFCEWLLRAPDSGKPTFYDIPSASAFHAGYYCTFFAVRELVLSPWLSLLYNYQTLPEHNLINVGFSRNSAMTRAMLIEPVNPIH